MFLHTEVILGIYPRMWYFLLFLPQIWVKFIEDLHEQGRSSLRGQLLLSFIILGNSMTMRDRLRLIIHPSIIKFYFCFNQWQNRRTIFYHRGFFSFAYKLSFLPVPWKIMITWKLIVHGGLIKIYFEFFMVVFNYI